MVMSFTVRQVRHDAMCAAKKHQTRCRNKISRRDVALDTASVVVMLIWGESIVYWFGIFLALLLIKRLKDLKVVRQMRTEGV